MATTDTLAKPAALASFWNSCNVRSLAPTALNIIALTSMRNAACVPTPTSDCTKSGSTDSAAITFPPLAGNALKQLRKIVTHSESFQLSKTHCQSTQVINDVSRNYTLRRSSSKRTTTQEEEGDLIKFASEMPCMKHWGRRAGPSWRRHHRTVRSRTCFHPRAQPLSSIWKLALKISAPMLRSQSSWWCTI